MTPKQCIEACRLLGWSRDRLCGASTVPAHAIGVFEQTGKVMRSQLAGAKADPLAAIRAAIEAAGVQFLDENGGGAGVRLRTIETLTPELCLQARRLLGWSHYRLAGLAGLPESFVQVFERTGRAGVGRTQSSAERLAAARHVLEAAGVVFATGDGPGVQLRKPK